jgi:PAS domain S-box-containing protein
MNRSYPSPIRRFGCWGICALCVTVCLVATGGAHASESGPAKRVLLISTGSRLSPGFALVDQGVLEALAKIPSGRVETYAENLDILRFPTERFQRIFTEYLTEKYAEQPPDLIILVFVGNLGIAGKLLQQLFPGTPVIVAGFTEEEVRLEQFGSLVSGIAQRVDPRGTLELILRLQPETRRIIVIGGTAEVDRSVLNRVKDAASSFAGRIEFDFWDNRSMAELRQAVAALPPQTAILFSRMFRDGAGQAVISTQAGQSIAQFANVPVYVMTDLALGTGAVGGSVGSIEAFGKRAGELARLILSGSPPASLPFEIRTDSVPMFDWRALKRWGISESRLPSNSIVRFRPPSMWEQYRWYILSALIIIFLQSAMIVDLLLQRRRRRRIEGELRESQQLMELAANAGELGLWSRDLEKGEIWANPHLRTLFGFSQDEPLQLNDLLVYIHPDDRTRVAYDIERAQMTEMPFEGEFRVVPPDGRERWVVARGKTVSDFHGMRRMGVILDITERKRAEEKFRLAVEELQRHREDLAHVTRVSTVGELTTSVAHELNQPLGAILSNAEAAEMFLAADPPALDEVRDILADIRKDDQRASEVIRRMRSLLRKQELAPKSIEINEALEEVLRLLSIDATARKVAVKFERTAGLPLVWCDPVHLQQVVLNLVLNGMEAMTGLPEEKRQVIVRTGPANNGTVQIAVADSGPGIPVDRLPKLFEPFFTTKKEGLGMGLTIARTIVEAHHGQIWAENNSGAGATFYFTVPVHEGKAEGRVSRGE